MMDADALEPVDDLIDDIGRNKFSKTALSEGKKDGTCYSLPLYSHAQVMWYRKDLLQKAGLSVPKTWDEFAEAAKTLTKDGVYGCSFPCGSNDLMATRFLNFYVRSGGGSLLTDDLKANLTSDLAIDGINYWLDIYKNCSPKDSVNYAVLDQANLFYQGKTAFDFNSGFQISGVETNSPDLVDQIDCAPLPKINADDPDYGAETSNIPMVVWKNSKHPEICKAFMKKLYEKDTYIKFLDATPVGMLPSISGISDTPEYKENETVQKFSNAVDVISDAMDKGTAKLAYPFEGTINSVGVYQDVISDDELVQLTGQTTYADNIFYAGDATKSNYFRIPSLLTLDSGTVIAAADARYGGTHDSKSKINTAFAKSTDGGNTWGEPTLPMKFDDYVAKNIDWPRDSVGKNVQIQGSASYIDPVLLEDKSTHRVFLFADLMPAGIGSSNASVGSGFKEINGKKYLKLHWKDDSSSDYNYSIRENGIIYDDTTNASTEYSVDGEYNLYKNGEALTCKQYDYNFEGTSLLETPTDTDVNMNVFYKDSMFKVFPTNYLAMKYSDDEGDNWSDLNIVSTFKPEESKFLVLGPGIGKQITTGENAGRLIVPLYSKSSAELGFMYSDDHGNSWNYVEADHNTGGATAEAQIVEMPDGSLKTYLRTGSGYIAEVTSIDGGETWSDRVPLTEIATTSYGTQLSVINYSQPIDGKPAIILSAPNATNGRKNGKIWIGLINETGQSGVNKYSVEWKNLKCNRGRMEIKRIIGVMANKELRKKYFGF